jgi:hypothetical protein
MDWRRRLFEMVCAGGALLPVAAGACWTNGNRAPDLCSAGSAETPQCMAEQCRAEGGTWELESGRVIDAGADSGVEGHCVFPCAGPAFNCAADAAFDAATRDAWSTPRDAIGGD